jgi:hypothetical protein
VRRDSGLPDPETRRDLPGAGSRAPSQILEHVHPCDPLLPGWSVEVRLWLAADCRSGAQQSSALVDQWGDSRDLGFDLFDPPIDPLECG